MCCVLEIGLLIYGIIALITGKMKFSRDKVVQGTTARILGAVGVCTLPLAILVASIAIGITVASGKAPDSPDARVVTTAAEAVVVLLGAGIVFGVGFAVGKPEQQFVQPYGQPPGQGWSGNAPYAPPSNNPYQGPNQPPQQGGPFDPFRQ